MSWSSSPAFPSADLLGDHGFSGEDAGEQMKRAGFGPGRAVILTSLGQYTCSAIARAVIDLEPSERWTVDIATWNLGHHDLAILADWYERRRIHAPRIILDGSYPALRHASVRKKIQRDVDPAGGVRVLEDLVRHSEAGRVAYRLIGCHAKWCLLSCPGWRCVVLSSANWNHAPRMEFAFVIDSAPCHEHLADAHERLWRAGVDDLGSRPINARRALSTLKDRQPEPAGIPGTEHTPHAADLDIIE